MSVARAQREISSREFGAWQAYWRLEPWGEKRADWRAGLMCATMANVWSSKGARAKPEDFMPQEQRSAEMTGEEIAGHMRHALRTMFGPRG